MACAAIVPFGVTVQSSAPLPSAACRPHRASNQQHVWRVPPTPSTHLADLALGAVDAAVGLAHAVLVEGLLVHKELDQPL